MDESFHNCWSVQAPTHRYKWASPVRSLSPSPLPRRCDGLCWLRLGPHTPLVVAMVHSHGSSTVMSDGWLYLLSFPLTGTAPRRRLSPRPPRSGRMISARKRLRRTLPRWRSIARSSESLPTPRLASTQPWHQSITYRTNTNAGQLYVPFKISPLTHNQPDLEASI